MKKIDSDLKKIILAKVENYDDDWMITIGGKGSFDKESITKEIENETEVGLKMVEIENEFMTDLANGKFYQALNDAL